MRTIGTRQLALFLMVAVASGCTNSSDTGNAGGDHAGGSTSEGIRLSMGSEGTVELRGTAAAMSKQFNVSDQVPSATPSSATLTLQAASITVDALDGSTEPVNAAIIVQLFWDRPDAPTPCGSFPEPTRFDLVVKNGEVTDITPATGSVDSNPLAIVATGEFGVCAAATATANLRLTIDEALLEFE